LLRSAKALGRCNQLSVPKEQDVIDRIMYWCEFDQSVGSALASKQQSDNRANNSDGLSQSGRVGLDQGLTRNYLKDTATIPQWGTQTMKTRVEKLGPGSWVVFVNGQRHHETFLTRSAARREAGKQKEIDKIDNES
jgi:hypothetical protein